MQKLDLGSALIRPGKPVTAGSFQTIRLVYTAGHPIDDTGYLKIAFRFAGDFGAPQFDDPKAPNFCSVTTTANCRIDPRWDPKGHTRPFGYAIYLKIMKGYVNTNEKIILTFGDTSGGSPGWQVQTFCEETFEFQTHVDPIATYEFKQLPVSPTLKIVPGKASRALCVAPSQVQVNTKFSYHLKLEDRWGNPVRRPKRLTHPGFPKSGVRFLSAKDPKTGLSARSNPVAVVPARPTLTPYWADFHGQSEETVGSNSIEDYFAFARNYGLVDAVGHQGNDFQVTDEFWTKINRLSRQYYEPGRFVTFPGYEWSGNTPLGGDRNVYFVSEGGDISRSCTDLLPGKTSKYPDSPTAARLFRNLKKQKGPDAFAFAHVGGRFADLDMHDKDIEVAMEVHSAWGTFEWLVEDAFERGYRIGICANSDGHKCRPGTSYPGAKKFGSLGGLTCILSRKLDRKSVVGAMRARHFYATTGNRPIVNVALETADGRRAMMGDVIRAGRGNPILRVQVTGTGPLESVIVRNGLDPLGKVIPYHRDELGQRVKIVWSGAEVRGRARLVEWDGSLQIKGNSIRRMTPINFWNTNKPIRKLSKTRLEWESITTGGLAGMILTLDKPDAGTLKLETVQRRVKCPIRTTGLKPKTWHCGGLEKKIEIYRLPDKGVTHALSFDLPLTNLRKGDNPIYIRMMQEDGHMAWSSPIYVVK